jgi:DNA-directed RNA polymerase specialized sigma24 family protein
VTVSSPAVDEVLEFCRRALVSEELAQEAARAAERAPDRLGRLIAACTAGRELLAGGGAAGAATDGAGEQRPAEASLRDAVARELAAANALLAEPYREALALRERLGLRHEEIAAVMGLDAAEVAALLARARLALRAARRGPLPAGVAACPEGERSLALLARHQDGEPLAPEEDQWLLDHLVCCDACELAHAAMLEASACYRAWGEPAR